MFPKYQDLSHKPRRANGIEMLSGADPFHENGRFRHYFRLSSPPALHDSGTELMNAVSAKSDDERVVVVSVGDVFSFPPVVVIAIFSNPKLLNGDPICGTLDYEKLAEMVGEDTAGKKMFLLFLKVISNNFF